MQNAPKFFHKRNGFRDLVYIHVYLILIFDNHFLFLTLFKFWKLINHVIYFKNRSFELYAILFVSVIELV